GIHRVEPGTRLTIDASGTTSTRYYLPEYPSDLQGSDEKLAGDLRERIITTVQDFRPHADSGWGCFLSGGTDSSSIVSILARQGGAQVQSCSIGFREAGYDELDFARLAGEACGAKPHLAQVDHERALDLLDSVIQAYDQPFGNASAVPTLACAELGQAEGFSVMLGGDGGDEIFGGNQRYSKDKVMESFYRMPSPLKAAARAIGNAVGGGNNHLLNRIKNFTLRSSLPNPDRFYTDDSFASDYYEQLLTPEFRQHVSKDSSLELMRELYEEGSRTDQLHQIMRLDLLMAIAQNDLVKVHRACKHHGVSARFPFLDPALVEYCGQLAATHKVRGLKKRYLFKQAMADILPQEILRKRKQGFGLPIAIWMKDDPALQARVREVLLDDRTRQRGWVNPDFIAQLVDLHMAGGWDHSTAIWQLLVLELWMRSYMDA
ncbi:MAG: asparagine synthase C-terminal domain-containing protein, partial [Pseudoxanthomonas sp.]